MVIVETSTHCNFHPLACIALLFGIQFFFARLICIFASSSFLWKVCDWIFCICLFFFFFFTEARIFTFILEFKFSNSILQVETTYPVGKFTLENWFNNQSIEKLFMFSIYFFFFFCIHCDAFLFIFFFFFFFGKHIINKMEYWMMIIR